VLGFPSIFYFFTVNFYKKSRRAAFQKKRGGGCLHREIDFDASTKRFVKKASANQICCGDDFNSRVATHPGNLGSLGKVSEFQASGKNLGKVRENEGSAIKVWEN